MSHKKERDGYSHDPSCTCSAHGDRNWKEIVAIAGARFPGITSGDRGYAWEPRSTVVFSFQATFPRRQREVLRCAIERWQSVLGKGLSLNLSPNDDDADQNANFLMSFLPLQTGRPADSPRTMTSRGVEALLHKSQRSPKVWPNMVFGFDLCTPWGYATALHEVGHALGLGHEHQRAAVREPEPAVNNTRILQHFRYQENWPDEVAQKNIVEIDTPSGQPKQEFPWDPYSIMHYPFPCFSLLPNGLFQTGTPRNLGLSRGDVDRIRQLYPIN